MSCKIYPSIKLEPGEGIIISLDTLALESFRFDQEQPQSILLTSSESSREIIDISIEKHKGLTEGYIPNRDKYILPSDFIDEYLITWKQSNCSVVVQNVYCLKIMPFIEFDDNGVCNYCRNYQPINYLGLDALLEELEPNVKIMNLIVWLPLVAGAIQAMRFIYFRIYSKCILLLTHTIGE